MSGTPADHPVVLAHGWGGSARASWRESGLAGLLRSAGRDVTTPSLPGHSMDASASDDPHSYSALTELFSESLPLGSFDGVGYSLGGKLLLDIARREPGRIRRLVLIGVGANAFSPERGEDVARALLQGVDADTPPPIAQVVEAALATGQNARAMAAVIRRPARPLQASDLDALRTPTLLIAGARDRIAQHPEVLAAAIQGSELAVLPDLDHGGLIDSHEVWRACVSFLAASPEAHP